MKTFKKKLHIAETFKPKGYLVLNSKCQRNQQEQIDEIRENSQKSLTAPKDNECGTLWLNLPLETSKISDFHGIHSHGVCFPAMHVNH